MSGSLEVSRRELSRLRSGDVMSVGILGLRSRKARTLLTATGVAIGIAAMIAVLGITASSDAQLQADLDELGPNLLEVTPGDSITGDDVGFPAEAAGMIERIGPVDAAAQISPVDTSVRRTEFVPEGQTGGISVVTADAGLLDVVGGTVAHGTSLDEASESLPNVVLGAVAAERLGIHDVEDAPLVYLTNTYFRVVGILEPIELAPGIDRSAIIGRPIAEELFASEESPSLVFVRTDPEVPDDEVLFDRVREVIAATVIPSAPNEVAVTRPSVLLDAQASAESTFNGLLLGLGAVALLVGGVGIANVMVISVLERRTEIGVRRALGATRRHIRLQFIVESSLLALLGGIGGLTAGTVITVLYARSQNSVVSVPVSMLALGVLAALAVGAIAGLYPASRAARLHPADAVRPGAG